MITRLSCILGVAGLAAGGAFADTIPDRFLGTYTWQGQVCDASELSSEFPFQIVVPDGVKFYEGFCSLLEVSAVDASGITIKCGNEVEGDLLGEEVLSFSLSNGQRCDLDCSDPWPDACRTTTSAASTPTSSSDVSQVMNSVKEFYRTNDQQVFFDLVEKLKRSGYLPAAEVWRADYVSTFVPNTVEYFFGFEIALVEHEYFDVNAGCCVREGFGLIVYGQEDQRLLQDFAEENGCKVVRYDNFELLQLHAPNALKVDPAMIYNFECRSEN